jgi:uncharacterized protein (DUF736 family)
MSNNGMLKPHEGRNLAGFIATLTAKMDVTLTLNPDYRSGDEKSPKFHVNGKGPGGFVRIGGAWEKTASEASAHPGEKFLSITVDDPSLDGPLNVTAYPRDGGTYEIVWRRSRRTAETEAAQ